jgi:hypothetical protein
MDPLGDPVTTRSIQTGLEFTMEPYPSGQFGCIDDPDSQFGNGSVWTRTLTGSDGPELILTLCITVLFTTLVGKNTIYRMCNADTKLIDIAMCSRSNSTLMVSENVSLIRYYKHSANTTALYESIDGPAGRPADNPPNSDGLGDYHGTVPEWAVCICWRPRAPIWQQFSLDLNLDPKWRSGTSADSIYKQWIP